MQHTDALSTSTYNEKFDAVTEDSIRLLVYSFYDRVRKDEVLIPVFGKHMALTGITQEHFVRWLALFEQTATQLYADAPVSEIFEIADRIAGSLQLGFFGERAVRI